MMLEGLGNSVDAIYDVTIGYQNDDQYNIVPSFESVLYCMGRNRVVKVIRSNFPSPSRAGTTKYKREGARPTNFDLLFCLARHNRLATGSPEEN